MNPYKPNNYKERTEAKPWLLLSFIFFCAAIGISIAAFGIYLFLLAITIMKLSIFVASCCVVVCSMLICTLGIALFDKM